jgi:hypothetical protein
MPFQHPNSVDVLRSIKLASEARNRIGSGSIMQLVAGNPFLTQ